MPSTRPPILDRILEILQQADEPLTIPQIEKKLAEEIEADTFDVRDAVWRLVAERRARFTPKRFVTIAEQPSTQAP